MNLSYVAIAKSIDQARETFVKNHHLLHDAFGIYLDKRGNKFKILENADTFELVPYVVTKSYNKKTLVADLLKYLKSTQHSFGIIHAQLERDRSPTISSIMFESYGKALAIDNDIRNIIRSIDSKVKLTLLQKLLAFFQRKSTSSSTVSVSIINREVNVLTNTLYHLKVMLEPLNNDAINSLLLSIADNFKEYKLSLKGLSILKVAHEQDIEPNSEAEKS